MFALEDTTTHRLSASFLLDGHGGRFPDRQAGELADQFLRANRDALECFEIDAHANYDGRGVDLVLETCRRVGAVPLKSPTTGEQDYGLVVKPRFGWEGVGPILGRTGWHASPTVLELPELPKSDREIPPWVLSSIVLPKLRALLEDVDRDFEMVERDLRAPRGSVDWGTYAIGRIARGRLQDVPCRFPDLCDDRDLLSAVRFALERHRGSLQTQRGAGPFVQRLLSLCERLLGELQGVEPRRPGERELEQWLETSFGGEERREAVRAIRWTAEQRGLAGLGELQGLPWSMAMEEFFESWVEHLAERLARSTGGTVHTGRERQTVVPLRWEPDYAGSQRALVPDVVLERPDRTVILDAKYKRHFEELEHRGWHDLADHVRETHRDDLLQVLAYAATTDADNVTTCLVYPCTRDTWNDLHARSRTTHRARVGSGSRDVDLVLAAVPLSTVTSEVTSVLGETLGRSGSS
ncbi:MAG: hypothetical protein ABEL76_10185 [Bradymonadaceae bacterium]